MGRIFLVEPPGHLSQLLRSWKSEFGSYTLFSRGVPASQLQLKLAGMQLLHVLEKKTF